MPANKSSSDQKFCETWAQVDEHLCTVQGILENLHLIDLIPTDQPDSFDNSLSIISRAIDGARKIARDEANKQSSARETHRSRQALT